MARATYVMVAVGAILCTMPCVLSAAGDPPGNAAHEVPPIFAKMTIAQANAKAKGTDKVVVADFTADWCQPCKLMDRTTWRDPKVVDWLKANAIAVQIDVDKSRDVAKELAVSAMPTVLVYKNGEMVQRRVGYQTGEQLLGLLVRTKSARKVDGMEAVVLPAPAQRGAGDVDKVSMQERLSAARELVADEKFAAATDEYVWLWKNIARKDPSMSGVRGSFMAGDMERLAQQHKPARLVFTQERDRAEARLKTEDKTFADLDDWIVLNGVIGDQEATLAWFDRVKNDADVGPTFQRVGFRLKRLLEDKGRWADLGRLQSDPIGALRQSYQMWKRMPAPAHFDAEFKKQLDESHKKAFRDEAAMLYVSQLACGKEDQAAAVRDEALRLDKSGQMRAALVEKAVQARQVRRAMLDDLKQAEKDGAEVKKLRQQLVAALGEGAG